MAETLAVPKQKLSAPPLAIHRLGDRVLRQSSKRVSQVNAEIRQLAREMLQTMYSADGIGLAAPQVGVAKQVIVVDVDPENAANPPLILVNPVIESLGTTLATGQEGCLSIPGVYLEVRRPAAVEVSYKDEHGRPQRRWVDDLTARVIQHETDHLHGILFVDRVESPLKLAQELARNRFSLADVRRIPPSS